MDIQVDQPVCEDISDELHLHVMSPARRPPPPVRVERSCLNSRSKRLRSQSEQKILAEFGHRVKVLELQGELSFAAGELITSSALNRAEETDFAVLDFNAVRAIDLIDVPIFSHLIESCEEAGSEIAFSDVDRHPAFLDELTEDAMAMAPHAFSGNARALARFDYTGRAGAYTGPVMVVWGRKDSIITEAMARETAAAYRGSRLLVLDSVGHSVMALWA